MLFRKKNKFNSSRLKKTRRKKILNRIFLCVLILIVVFIVSIFVSKINSINISEITVQNDDSITTADEIKEIVQKNIDGKYFWLYPKTNIFLYDKTGIEQDIRDKFKRIKNVNIENIGFNTLKIAIKERNAYALWCGTEIIPEDKCYFLDDEGYIYSEAPTFSGNVFFKNYGSIKNENPLGISFLETKKFKEISFLIKSIKDMNLNPVSFLASENGDYEIYLSDNSNSYNFYGGKIIFNKDDDLGKIFDNLTTILSENALTKEFNHAVQLDYIDLRFGKKVFYKFQ